MCAVRSPVAPHSDWLPSRSDTSTSRMSAIKINPGIIPNGPGDSTPSPSPFPPASHRPRYPVSTPPPANSGLPITARCISRFVATPSTTHRSSASRNVPSASARSAPYAITLASSES